MPERRLPIKGIAFVGAPQLAHPSRAGSLTGVTPVVRGVAARVPMWRNHGRASPMRRQCRPVA